MKLLINDKKRNIYFRKDNTAYYKSGGSENDVTSMFKKTGGGLKKQFSNLLIEGDEKSANMLGGKTKTRKNKLVGGDINKKFSFESISVTYDPNIPKEATSDDLKTKLAELKRTHKVLLLLSILKAIDTEGLITPTIGNDDFVILGNDYNDFKVDALRKDVKESVKEILGEINKIPGSTVEDLTKSYGALRDLMSKMKDGPIPAPDPGPEGDGASSASGASGAGGDG
jgi:hypothetical protein